MRELKIEGKFVYLEEVKEKYFPYIIEWRNDPENKKYLNQNFLLTMELQYKWYKDYYLNDITQGLLVLVDKRTDMPFGTLGWTNYDADEKVCISGRSLVGKREYRGSKEFLEARLLISDFFYDILKVDAVYAHILNNNIRSILWDKKWGFILNDKDIRYPDKLKFNDMIQNEYIRTRNRYFDIRDKMVSQIYDS